MIQHVALEVREDDIAACLRFWALLGFAPATSVADGLAQRTCRTSSSKPAVSPCRSRKRGLDWVSR